MSNDRADEGYRTDPDPDSTTGLEPGGGVAPGETPPMSGSTSEGNGRQPSPRERQTPVVLLVFTVLAVLLAVLVLVWAATRLSL